MSETFPAGAPAEGAWDDERLVQKAREGDRDAFDLLVEAHMRRVWNVVWRIVRHEEDTEDVVQEVFLTAWRNLGTFRGEARFSTWLHSIAVTRALNHLDRASERMRRRSVPLEPSADPPSERERAAPIDVRASGAPSPLELLEAAELERRLAVCLDRLPPAWRAVLALRDEQDRSYEEIARLMGLALGTVRSRLARARVALKQCVEGRDS